MSQWSTINSLICHNETKWIHEYVTMKHKAYMRTSGAQRIQEYARSTVDSRIRHTDDSGIGNVFFRPGGLEFLPFSAIIITINMKNFARDTPRPLLRHWWIEHSANEKNPKNSLLRLKAGFPSSQSLKHIQMFDTCIVIICLCYRWVSDSMGGKHVMVFAAPVFSLCILGACASWAPRAPSNDSLGHHDGHGFFVFFVSNFAN